MLIISVLLCLLLPSCYVGILMFTWKENIFTVCRIFLNAISPDYFCSSSLLFLRWRSGNSPTQLINKSLYANYLLYFVFSPRQPVRVRYCGVVARSVHLFSHVPSLLAHNGTVPSGLETTQPRGNTSKYLYP